MIPIFLFAKLKKSYKFNKKMKQQIQMSTLELEIHFLHFWHIISNDVEY